ncbi:ORF107 [Betabaculovirus altermyunipunctae]|uniref:ORF107 n=1 Tax=Betabaculovirus altermyunipunctae TaxID=3051996 RepID=A0A1S5YE98_9BBAC|nr:ORF107 [Betabaculovirus altermyunipunctae]AQQ80374.1 ORF107 [Betabaculovirus altermyunipunctae]
MYTVMSLAHMCMERVAMAVVNERNRSVARQYRRVRNAHLPVHKLLFFNGKYKSLGLVHFSDLMLPYVTAVIPTQPGPSLPYIPNASFMHLLQLNLFARKPFEYIVDSMITQNYSRQPHLLPDHDSAVHLRGHATAIISSRRTLIVVVVYKNAGGVSYTLIPETRYTLYYFNLRVCVQMLNRDYLYICHPIPVRMSTRVSDPFLTYD